MRVVGKFSLDVFFSSSLSRCLYTTPQCQLFLMYPRWQAFFKRTDISITLKNFAALIFLFLPFFPACLFLCVLNLYFYMITFKRKVYYSRVSVVVVGVLCMYVWFLQTNVICVPSRSLYLYHFESFMRFFWDDCTFSKWLPYDKWGIGRWKRGFNAAKNLLLWDELNDTYFLPSCVFWTDVV